MKSRPRRRALDLVRQRVGRVHRCRFRLGGKANEQLTPKVRQVAEADYDISYWLASAYLLQGRQVEALRWLETAISLGNENYKWFESDPNWADMHEDPRFVELMNRIKSQREQPGEQSE